MSRLAWTGRPVCFFADRPGAGPCDGALIRAHLIPKQRIGRERDAARAAERRGMLTPAQRRLLLRPEMHLLWDPAVWVPMCGGPMGQGGHHGMLDGKQLRIARADLPPALEEFARRYGFEWSLEADYGLED